MRLAGAAALVVSVPLGAAGVVLSIIHAESERRVVDWFVGAQVERCDPDQVAEAIDRIEPYNAETARVLADAFLVRCSEDVRILRLAYHGAFERGNFRRAADVAARLVFAQPWEATHHFLRARARRALGDRDGAVRDYRAGMALAPEVVNVPSELASLIDSGQ